MTVNTTNITSGPYSGNGLTSAFSYDFRIENKNQILVYETDSDGVQTLLTVDTDYTVSGLGDDDGGTVTRVAGALPSGSSWYIRSNYDDTQNTDFSSQGGFFPDVHEAAFDKLTFQIQQINDRIARSVRISDSDDSESVSPIEVLTANAFVRVNAAADGFETYTLGAAGVVAEVPLAAYDDFRNGTADFNINDYSDGQVVWFTNDGIRGPGVIKTGATPADNGGTIIRSTVDTTRYWKRFYEGDVYATWFGAALDGVTDDSAAIQGAINSITYGTVVVPYSASGCLIAATITIPIGIYLAGEGAYTTITVSSAGTYTNSYAVLKNTTNGTDWIQSYPNFMTGGFKNLFFKSQSTSLKAIAASGSTELYNCIFNNFGQSFVGSAQYNDQIRLTRVYCFSTSTAQYQIDLKNTGDCVLLDQIHTPNISNSPLTPMKSIKVSNNGVKITNSLLGDVYLSAVNGISSVSNVGMDGGKFYLDKSVVEIKNCSLSAHPTAAVIECINDGVSNYKVKLENIMISHDVLRDEYDPYLYDLKTANNTQIEIKNVTRNIIYNTAPESKQQHGIKILKEGGSAFTEFNNLSHFYSQMCVISDERIIEGNVGVQIPNTSLFYFGAISTTSILVWDKPSATYYYRMQVLWEPSRLIGRSDLSGERNIAVTNAGDGVALTIGTSNFPRPCIVRVYRGTTTGSYDEYVDIPIVSSSVLWDKGTYVSGHQWQSRTAGAMDTINSFAISGFAIDSGLVKINTTAVASVGSWTEGDLIENSAMSVDANNMVLEGWRRITTGAGHTLGTDWARRHISDVSPAT